MIDLFSQKEIPDAENLRLERLQKVNSQYSREGSAPIDFSADEIADRDAGLYKFLRESRYSDILSEFNELGEEKIKQLIKGTKGVKTRFFSVLYVDYMNYTVRRLNGEEKNELFEELTKFIYLKPEIKKCWEARYLDNKISFAFSEYLFNKVADIHDAAQAGAAACGVTMVQAGFSGMIPPLMPATGASSASSAPSYSIKDTTLDQNCGNLNFNIWA